MIKKVKVNKKYIQTEEFLALLEACKVESKEINGEFIIYDLFNPKFRVVKGDTAEIISKDGILYISGDNYTALAKLKTKREGIFSLQYGEIEIAKTKKPKKDNEQEDSEESKNNSENIEEIPSNYSELYQLALSKGFDIEKAGNRKMETLRKFLLSADVGKNK